MQQEQDDALDALTAEYKRKTEELEVRIKVQEDATKDCEANYEKWDEAMNELNGANIALDGLILAKNAASEKLLANGFKKADAEAYMEVGSEFERMTLKANAIMKKLNRLWHKQIILHIKLRRL